MMDILCGVCLISSGFFIACMDTHQFAQRDPLRSAYEWLRDTVGLKEGTRVGFIVVDYWHTAKNLLLLSLSKALAFAQAGEFSPWVYLLGGPVIGSAFAFFFHVVFRNAVYLK